jgi:hypothetical protein
MDIKAMAKHLRANGYRVTQGGGVYRVRTPGWRYRLRVDDEGGVRVEPENTSRAYQKLIAVIERFKGG